jgi:hypothetical protein
LFLVDELVEFRIVVVDVQLVHSGSDHAMSK